MTQVLIVERDPGLPDGARSHRHIGPFDGDDIPAGLLRRHDLKCDVWGILSVDIGSIRFCWDDERGGSFRVTEGFSVLIPPLVPHHLEREGPVTIRIEFCSDTSPRECLGTSLT
ncbi:DUF1971 domain-containing protein [Sphingopyxis fribergensis]|uniref:DUF1971 domain-containing protein n=1 Tax=Sphingopyxis fribergensis TaxID=1515612 RepID=UPI0009DD1909